MYDTNLQSNTFHNFAPLIALFFSSNTSRFLSKKQAEKIQRKEIVHMEFPHLYVFHVLKEVFLGIIVQQNS